MLSHRTSILFLGRDRLVRADFSSPRAQRPSLVIQRERPESDDPVLLISALTGDGAPRLQRVFILTTDCWTNVFEIAASTTSGMSDDALGKTLSYEAEPLSSISAFDSAGAVRDIGNEAAKRRFWFTQLPGYLREQFDYAVSSHGGKLAGISHPGGLPSALANADARQVNRPSWQRIEFWNTATIYQAWRDGHLTHFRTTLGRQSVATQEIVIEQWRNLTAAVSPVEVLLPDQAAEHADDQKIPFSLLDETTLADWLTRWNQIFGKSRPVVPIIPRLVRPVSDRTRGLVAAALGVMMGIGCYTHHNWTKTTIKQFSDEQVAIEKVNDELRLRDEDIKKANASLTTTQQELTKLETNVAQAESTLTARRKRLSELLEQLASSSTDGWVLQRVESQADRLVLHGTTIHPNRINALTGELAEGLGSLGWNVIPPKQTAQYRMANGAPWVFELTLVDTITPVQRKAVPARSDSIASTANNPQLASSEVIQ